VLASSAIRRTDPVTRQDFDYSASFIVHDHLPKNSGLKKSVNELLTKGFSVNTIADKLLRM